ncbi:MAG: TIGR02206 family membrane protein, partial [Phycisphaerales bacterium]|nr:TIGR02206 family membrane protein [Phycisphaerales bacterium]
MTVASPTPAFSVFGPTHLVAVGVCIAAMAIFVLAGRQANEQREPQIARTWAVFWLIQQAIATTYWLLPAQFEIGKSLPLHLCDVLGWLGPFALLLAAPPRWLRTILYFWGIGLSTQAFFTPTLEQGPGDLRFWLFWISHTQI